MAHSDSPQSDPVLERTLANRMFGIRSLPPLPGLVLTVFLDLLAFGLFIPDLQIRGKELGLSGVGLGLVLSAYSFAQLICAPLLGSISDSKGRRVILISSSCLSILSYVVYAHMGHSVFLMVLSRSLLGMGAGNLSVAFAYAADISAPEKRASSIGALGAAIGVGFIIGPVAGALLIGAAHGQTWLLGYAGAALVFINLLYIILFLPEPIRHEAREKTKMMSVIKTALHTRALAYLLLMISFVGLGFTNLESTYFLLLSSPASIFRLGDERARTVGALLLAVIGVTSALTQSVLVKKLTPRFGEARLLKVCYPMLAIAFLIIPFAPLWVPAIAVTILMALSMGISGPNVNSLLSRTAPASIQGAIFGLAQSLQAMARLIGPVISQVLFAEKPSYPYLLGSILVGVGAVLAIRLKPVAPNQSASGSVQN